MASEAILEREESSQRGSRKKILLWTQPKVWKAKGMEEKTWAGTWLGQEVCSEAEGNACGKPEHLEFQAERLELHVVDNEDGVHKFHFNIAMTRVKQA